jgi:hypothetical protein
MTPIFPRAAAKCSGVPSQEAISTLAPDDSKSFAGSARPGQGAQKAEDNATMKNTHFSHNKRRYS